jgi:hypothetical protein
MTGGTISGNCGEYGGGVLVDDGAFAVSGNPVISGNTNDVEDVSNVYLNENLTIAVSNLTAGAFLGVTTYPEPEEGSPVTITTGAVLGDVQYFFSDDPNCSVGTATNGEVYLVYGVAYPTYLDGADDTVKEYYEAWAAQHGPDTLNAYETEFLLDVAPGAVTNGLAPLKIVELGTTNIPTASDFGYIAMAMGYTGEYLPCRRIVLASDVAELKRSENFDTPFEACNGYLVLRIGADLSLPTSEWLAISWLVEFENGRAEVVFPELFMEGIRANFERAAGKPVSGLFLRACISPVPSLEWISNLGVLIEGP